MGNKSEITSITTLFVLSLDSRLWSPESEILFALTQSKVVLKAFKQL